MNCRIIPTYLHPETQGLLPPGQGFELQGDPYEGTQQSFVDELIDAVANDAVTLQQQEDAKRLAQQPKQIGLERDFELQGEPYTGEKGLPLLPPGERGFELQGDPYEGHKPTFPEELVSQMTDDAIELQMQEDAKFRARQPKQIPAVTGEEIITGKKKPYSTPGAAVRGAKSQTKQAGLNVNDYNYSPELKGDGYVVRRTLKPSAEVEVEVTGRTEDGQTITYKEKASVAIKEKQEQIEVYKKLRDCLAK